MVDLVFSAATSADFNDGHKGRCRLFFKGYRMD